MHQEAFDWLRRVKPILGKRRFVADLGAFNVNGSARELFAQDAEVYIGVDVRLGRGVDVVADAAWWRGPAQPLDLIISTECLEHTPYAAAICHNAYRLLEAGGVFLATAAGPKRAPHSVDGSAHLGSEFYRNVSEQDLREWLRPFPVVLIQDRDGQDVYALAIKGD